MTEFLEESQSAQKQFSFGLNWHVAFADKGAYWQQQLQRKCHLKINIWEMVIIF